MDHAIQVILDLFEDIFNKPFGLPPSQPTDHVIMLHLVARSIKVLSYRYLHTYKAEMPKRVDQMLYDNIIQPGRSPFTSLATLV